MKGIEMKNFYILSALLSVFLIYFVWQWMNDSKQANQLNENANRQQIAKQHAAKSH